MTIEYTDGEESVTIECDSLVVRLVPDSSGKNDYCDYIFIRTSIYVPYYRLCPLSSLLCIYS